MDNSTGLSFVECGIAGALMQNSYTVPLNQRSYKWTETQVQKLLDDLTKSFIASEEIYFLGMIVLTHGQYGQLEVADGQQRLATTSIIVAAVRDYLIELNDNEAAHTYQSKYLLEYDPPSKEYKAKLQLNLDDRDFFLETILKTADKRNEYKGRRFASHERIEDAAKLANQHIRNMTSMFTSDKEKQERMYEWMSFLQQNAKVIIITVPGYVGNAFKMFETLNARGMRASQIDILKNYLFDKGKNRIADIQPRWASMLNTIDSLIDADQEEDDLLIDYIRYYWIAHNGPTIERDLGEKIQEKISGERQASDLVTALDSFAVDFAALNMPREHSRLGDFNRNTRNCLYTITKELGAKQIFPLLLAILRYFEIQEAEKAFRLCLSWTVRFLVVGGAGGGVLDRYYGLRAKEISKREITKTSDLALKMVSVIHNDQIFEERFERAYVSKIKFARYYLRAIDLYLSQDPNPQFVPNEDTTVVNAEHILPIMPNADWNIAPDVVANYNKRLGNLVLMAARDNVKIGNKKFEDKKAEYVKSPYITTQWASKYDQWGPDEITDRQKKLANIAPLVWPI
jgi:hypothetical protein